VRDIAGKGLGMVATRTILPGETIITEDSVLVVDMVGTEEDRLESILDQVNKMPADTRARVENLYDSEPDGDPRLKVVRIFKSNSIQIGEDTESGAAAVAGLYPGIARINHCCAPNVVWSWTRGQVRRKQVRAVIKIEAGEELCTNYIDDFNTNYNTRDARQKVLSGWGFQCGCSVCSLAKEKLKVNNEIRCEIMRHHSKIPELVARQDLMGCVEASKAKLELLLSLGTQLITDLPAAYLETYEFLAIGKALKLNVEDPEIYRSKAEELSMKFGDKFEEGHKAKLNEILYGE